MYGPIRCCCYWCYCLYNLFFFLDVFSAVFRPSAFRRRVIDSKNVSAIYLLCTPLWIQLKNTEYYGFSPSNKKLFIIWTVHRANDLWIKFQLKYSTLLIFWIASFAQLQWEYNIIRIRYEMEFYHRFFFCWFLRFFSSVLPTISNTQYWNLPNNFSNE